MEINQEMEEKKIRPQDKWDEKAGVIAKSYKIHADIAEAFKAACIAKGISQAKALEALMIEFINK